MPLNFLLLWKIVRSLVVNEAVKIVLRKHRACYNSESRAQFIPQT